MTHSYDSYECAENHIETLKKGMNNKHMRQRQMWNGSIIDPLRNESEVTPAVNKNIHAAMRKQNPFDYAVKQEKISTNHRRRLDEHFQNWITLDPNHHNVPNIDIRSPLTRTAISNQTEAWQKVFIFERENDWKYIIHPYRQIGIENLSFWNQHITKTKLTGKLPGKVNTNIFSS